MMKNAKSGWFKAGAAVLLVLMGVLAFWGGPSAVGRAQEGESLYPISDYGWLTYYMHEVWWRYNDAKLAFDRGDMALAESNLIVMEIFAEVSKDKLPETLQDGRPFNQQEYIGKVDELKSYSVQIRKNLKQKKWADTPADKPDPLLATCVGCHASYNIPTDFRLDTPFKKLTHIMHEIYELYKQAGVLFMKGESSGDESNYDLARHCFLALRPYIEQIKKNIPDQNQLGEPIDKKLFEDAQSELKKYNEDMIKKLETKYWRTGKPLPPPRIVVDTCYACHDKVVKIDPPW